LELVDSKRDGETQSRRLSVYKFVEDKLTEKFQEAQSEAAEKNNG
jgi:hypothetical protein